MGAQPDRPAGETLTLRPSGARRPAAKGGEQAEPAGLAPRRAAARLLAAVIDARTPLDALTDAEHGHPQFLALSPRDRALARAILVTALRFRRTVAGLIEARLERRLPPNAATLAHILHVAAAQILFLDVPDSAAVDLAVAHAKADPRTLRFAALVNAVLRRLAREKEAALPLALAGTRDAPDWLARALESAYGGQKTEAILDAHRREPPVDFTVRGDSATWAARLGGMVLPTGSVRVERLAAPVPELPFYEEGAWWVQDAAASLPARLLGPVAGLDVADLCAAPGGKTAQLAAAGARVTALDISKSRLARLKANLARLGLEAQVAAADIAAFRPARLFDAVLLDAPCSSTGTIRRHPDVAWTKSPEDVAKLAALQRRLLDAAAKMVRPGGRLVFSNCSLLPQEGEALVAAFLAENDAYRIEPIRPDELPGLGEAVTAEGLLRTTPADLALERPEISGLDGFFAARMRRIDPT